MCSLIRLSLALFTLFACQSTSASTSPRPSRGKVSLPQAKVQAQPLPVVSDVAKGQLGPGAGTLLIGIVPPAGAELTLDAPLSVTGGGGIGLAFPQPLKGPLRSFELPLRLPIVVEDGATGPAELVLSYYWCTDGKNAACRREQTRLSVELDLNGSGAGGEAHFEYKPLLAAAQ